MTHIVHETLEFERMLDASATDVFAAFASKQALLDWSDPGEGWDMRYDVFDFRVSHTDVASFGVIGQPPYTSTTHYLAINSGTRIIYASTLTHKGKLTFVGTVTVELQPLGAAVTQLRLVEAGAYIDGADGPEGHRDGWNFMLDNLAKYLKRARRAA